MNKNKLLVTLLSTLIVILGSPYVAEARNRACNPSNAICPNETEFRQLLKARYLLKIKNGPKVLLYLTSDPDTKNGFKYDVRSTKGANIFGDGKGILDHEWIYFDLPLSSSTPVSEGKSPIHCIGQINPPNPNITGGCTTIAKKFNTLQLFAVDSDFVAKPLTGISIFGQRIKTDMLCLSNHCPARDEINKLLKTSYIFTANLAEDDRTENYRLDISLYPEDPTLFNLDVFDASTNSLIYGGGYGNIRYRRVYFNLPIVGVGSDDFSVYGCTGVINPSDSAISGECRTIDVDTSDQFASFYGDFTAVPLD